MIAAGRGGDRQTLTESVPEPRTEPAAHGKWFPQTAKVDVLACVRPLLEALDVLEVHDGGAVYPHEMPVGETLLPFAKRLRRRLSRHLRGESQRGAVPIGLDSDNVAHADEDALLSKPQKQAVRIGDGVACGRWWLSRRKPADRHGYSLGPQGLEQ